MGYLWGIGLALLAAVGVIVAANATGDGRTSVREFWADLRSGLRRRGARDDAAEPDAEPVDVPFAQIFAESSEPDDGYLQLDELAEMLERTGERAGRILPGRGEHGHRPARAAHPAAVRPAATHDDAAATHDAAGHDAATHAAAAGAGADARAAAAAAPAAPAPDEAPRAAHPRAPRPHPVAARRSGHEPAARRSGTATVHAPAAPVPSAPLPPAVPPQRRDG